jgi:hypothetical protein
MHHYLRKCIEQLAKIWEADPRAMAFAMNGSGGRGADDEWSDGDVALVVTDSAYNSVCGEMRGLMSRVCGDIRAWLPEGETDRHVNYALLFEMDGEQFLFDHAVFCESSMAELPYYDVGIIYFDRSGALTAADRRHAAREPDLDARRLCGIIDKYMVYAYLSGKYYIRKDTAKLLYIQNTLQTLHLQLIEYFYPETVFSGWWCHDIYAVDGEHRQTILGDSAARD